MNQTNFNGKAGELRLNALKIPTFYPYEIPDSLSFSNQFVSLLTSAEARLSELSGAGKLLGTGGMLPNPMLLVSPHIQQEAIASSRIEGTKISLPEVLRYESSVKPQKNENAESEIASFVDAIDYGIVYLKQNNLSLSMIKEMHKRMMANKPRTGELRKEQNFIGASVRIEDARFIPPAPEFVEPLMQDFEKYLNSNHNLPPIIQAGLIHYQFEAIHPFEDGNGRIGRSLILLYMLKKEILSQPLLSLSPFFEKYEPEYKERLFLVSQDGAYEKWLEFFLTGVSIQAKAALDRTLQLLALRNQYVETLRTKSSSSIAYRLVDLLFRYPYFTIPLAQERLKVHYQTAQRATNLLLAEGILEDINLARKRNKIFVAKDIMKIIDQV